MHDSGPRDEDLAARVARGDADAFEALFARYGDLVYSVAYRVLEDRHAAEDIAQEVFLKFWRRPSLFDAARGRFATWLISVTRNRAIDERRVRRRPGRDDAGAMEADPPTTDADDPGSLAVLVRERQAVREALSALPPEQRLAIELAYFGGLTQSEVAERLSLPLGTVKTRIRLGMQKLRAALERWGSDA
ncbi:MAG TPA: sigma-70 family RNA polymerase sigma factor [Dehalococcoidia bacterium]|nr:sigma-70 family RNA polymerase sigma factor [Dehalococcoidia bacterium]